uniref:Uncharacterized protein n=1 Tax=Parascaris equorum TaxID=6256 RepID=A0A914SB97_PAREQ
MNDATYDLNSITEVGGIHLVRFADGEPRNLFNVTPLDLSGVNVDEEKEFYCDDPDEVRAVIGEYAERIWSMFTAGEDLQIEVDAVERDVRNVWMSHGVPLPPKDIFQLKAILRNEVFTVLYPDSEKAIRKSRWETISRDSDLKLSSGKYALSKLVMDQLYRDQDRWRNFEPIEETIKEEMVADLFREQVAESFTAVNVSSKSVL